MLDRVLASQYADESLAILYPLYQLARAASPDVSDHSD